jgi:Spy/CpxP family protein refolding chaperone
MRIQPEDMTMMRHTSKLLAGLATAALLLGGAQAIARDHGPGGHGGDPGMRYMQHVLDELDLTPEQQATVKDIFESARPRLRALHQQMRDVRESLIDTNPDDPDYSTIVNQASQKSGELASDLVREMSQVRTQVHAVLTDEQKARLPEIRAEMQAKMQARRERMRTRHEARRSERAGAGE